MSRMLRVVPVLLLGLALGGCTAAATVTSAATSPATAGPSAGASGGVAAAEAGSDVGNDRPHVSFDGLMVRRRVVIAIRPTDDADIGSVRAEIDRAAGRLHLTLSTISPDVLDPAALQSLSPQLTLALPAGTTPAQAKRVIDPAPGQARRFPDVAAYDVSPVLVHDLRFTARSANPALLAQAIAREGILSDDLGSYTTTFGRHRLDITYTGPLLGDDVVESVRVGIARRANMAPAAVAVLPRSTTGVGVDMAKEPAPPPAPVLASTDHHHDGALSAVAAASPSSGPGIGTWVLLPAAGILVLLLLTLLVLMTRWMNRLDQA
jgi:hypothetical protein